MATSMFHAGVVTTQIGNALACRTERASVWRAGFWRNRSLPGSAELSRSA
jgi:hypothetical protein